MFHSQRGQTVLEYLIIATIIMAGIVIGGPFLAKAVGGHFRLLEDSAVDSIGEDIRQAPLPKLPATGCVCGDWLKSGCGKDDPCTPSQRIYTRSCNISGCIVEECRTAPDCCQDPVMVKCGTVLPDPPITGACPDSGRVLPKATTSTGAQIDVFDPGIYKGTCPEAPGNCKVWERLYSVTCGVFNPTNPSASKTYTACKDVKGEALNCGPECWDATRADGTELPGSSACDADETSPSNLPDEINMRFTGFPYGASTYLDKPPRAVIQRPILPNEEMYGAFQVINTYFDPTIDLHNPDADGCAPGQANYGTANCHRCRPNRRCEFICPPGTSPAPANTSAGPVENATCKPCGAGQVNQGSCGAGYCQAGMGSCSATECNHFL